MKTLAATTALLLSTATYSQEVMLPATCMPLSTFTEEIQKRGQDLVFIGDTGEGTLYSVVTVNPTTGDWTVARTNKEIQAACVTSSGSGYQLFTTGTVVRGNQN